jgi:hypothetical protein
MTESPTLVGFQEAVRDAFGYLVRDFAFREVQPPATDPERNPFLIWFVNKTTLVQVEGINWGCATQVIVGPAGSGDDWQATVPLWAIIKHRSPELYAEVMRAPDQLADIRAYARALPEVGEDVLRGNFGVFTAARVIIDTEMAQWRRIDTEHRLERERLAAVADATVALRAKNFPRVVELLTPHSESLTPAERAKLDYARAHSR